MSENITHANCIKKKYKIYPENQKKVLALWISFLYNKKAVTR